LELANIHVSPLFEVTAFIGKYRPLVGIVELPDVIGSIF
jgi:hypothetical protein